MSQGCAGYAAPCASVWHHLVGTHLLLPATMVVCGPAAAQRGSMAGKIFGIQNVIAFLPAGWSTHMEDFGSSLCPGALFCFRVQAGGHSQETWVRITDSRSPTPGQAVGRERPLKPPSPVLPLKRKQWLHKYLGVSKSSSAEFPATHKAITP